MDHEARVLEAEINDKIIIYAFDSSSSIYFYQHIKNEICRKFGNTFAHPVSSKFDAAFYLWYSLIIDDQK